MVQVNFYDLGTIPEDQLRYAVILAQYQGQWIYVKHRDRSTWEIPGGRREIGEAIEATACRELYEETGAEHFDMVPLCIYGVSSPSGESYGQLFFSRVELLGKLPDSEIERVFIGKTAPATWTYPLIQPLLQRYGEQWLSTQEVFTEKDSISWNLAE